MPQIKYASMVKASNGIRIKITFPYDVEMIHKVRELPGRTWHAEQKCWSAPVHVETLNTLNEWGFELDNHLKNYIEKTKSREEEIIEITGIPGLKGELYPFQRKGVAFLETKRGRALIADEMGLGKTVQALAWWQLHRDKIPVVVVVPASLKLNWKREAELWLPNPKVEILSGTKPWKLTGEIIIINYDILHAWLEYLKKINPAILITDECHYYKSNKAKRTKAVKQLGKNIPHVIALSGTPIVNRPIEAFNALKLIDPLLFPDYWHYAKYYCAAKQSVFGWDLNGASHIQELHQRLTSTVMIRRLKKDVLPDLPDKIYSFIPIELSNQKVYDEAEADFVEFVRKYKSQEAAERISNAEALASIEGLKQLAVKGKLEQSIDWIKNFLEIEDKLIVFATHKFVIDAIMTAFPSITVKIDGSVVNAERQNAVDNFQNNDKIKLFVGNIQAAGIGITLTASSNVAFIELPWTPGALVQAEDRCHRIGQKDSVNIYYLLAAGTIEEKIAHMIDDKRKVLDAVLDGRETDQGSLLKELMKQYK